ncbi:MAG: hypothetical protein A3I75_03665 [Deltaproteobacteria bacterium RIFCSPLOWO2_02_FULL_50_16]|nr:MAG: hypothetical protein A3B79_02990 [Deltaproteobacteria bacterium RIFCSPHIGHO2_02_FULL_50_15]OGQ55455.1 MAG: hypothetical protein A3I75_03665 [Deltaproteobacteria bacterium RIFCSPLOWO2_02_FULL_50_16]
MSSSAEACTGKGTCHRGGHAARLGANRRTDLWWIAPLLIFLGFSAFGVYTAWAAFQGQHYYAHPYLSPFYSPVIFVNTAAAGAAPLEHAWLGLWPDWWPAILPASPAFFILIFPLIFRGTCYYYRKAYYRSFFATPPGCSVGPIPQKNYKGETFLLVVQNLHRYTMYIALCFVVILYYDAFVAFFKDGRFGCGVGTLVLLINATLLGLYTTGCHVVRHIVGGRLNSFGSCECGSLQYGVYQKVSFLNSHHMGLAWVSLFWVGFTDIYVRLVSMGILTDLNTWGY